MIKNKGERLTTLGFGIPNLLKFGNVGYFPEQFIVDFGLQGKTASDIQRYFMSTGMDLDGDVMSRTYKKIHYFVDLKHNVFIKYDEIRNNAEYNKSFLSEAEKELNQIKDTNGHITDSNIAERSGREIRQVHYIEKMYRSCSFDNE